MKPKLKLEMKEKLFIASIMIYIASLVLLMGLGPGVFTGIWWIGVFANSQPFSVISTLIIGVIMILFTYLARKVNINFIYIVRGILVLLAILNAFFIGWEPISCSIYFIATVALLVMTFIKDNEYVIVTDLTQAEKENIEKDNRRERKHEIVGSILSFTIIPIVVFFLVVLASSPFHESNYEELKNRYRVDLPSEMATEEQCNEFLATIDNYENYNGSGYWWNDGEWTVDTELIGKMLKSNSNSDDYWMIGDDIDIIYHLFYDDWDNVADDYILIRSDYKFPDPSTAKVTKILFSYNKDREIELTEKEIEEIHGFIMGYNYDESKTQYYDEEYFEDSTTFDILWYFEDEKALRYEYGDIIKTTDGKYHLRSASADYISYTLSGEICEKLDKVW